MQCNMIKKTRKQKLSYEERKTTIQHKCSPPLKRETNPKLPWQMCKLSLVNGFGEDICKLVLGINMAKVNVPFLIVVTQEMKADIYMLCL